MRLDDAGPLSGSVPDGVVPLLGYREWAVWREGSRPTRLRSLFHPTVWPAGRPLGAVCLRPLIWHARTGSRHDGVPDLLCECGIYAFREPGFDTLRGAKGPKVRGVVYGWGRYVLGTSGWRTEFARVVALLEDRDNLATCRELARGYDIPVCATLREAAHELRPAVSF